MSNITARQHQLDGADEGIPILKENAIVYLNWEERTGKTLTSILIAEDTLVRTVLVITKKKAIDGWEETLSAYIHLNSYKVVNYHSAHKVTEEYDLIILDEAHAYISGYPKRSSIWAAVRKHTKGKPIIYLSATSHAQGTQLLYNQFALSDWSPWRKFKDFYEWFKHYAKRDAKGQLKMIYIGGNRQAIDYSAVDHDKVYNDVKHLFITNTRKELGFEHEPEDVLHYIELNEGTKQAYNTLLKDNLLEFTHSATGREYSIVCDTSIKLRWTLHMLEGGGFKYTYFENKKEKAEYLVLGNQEKIDYILENWGDSSDVAIMFQYKVEAIKLAKVFKHAKLYQADSFAEGVDLSMHKHLVIYSQSFSTSKHTQRRARQANMNREEEIKVHFLLVRKAVSEQVYKTVSVNKVNFVDSSYERETL